MIVIQHVSRKLYLEMIQLAQAAEKRDNQVELSGRIPNCVDQLHQRLALIDLFCYIITYIHCCR